MRYIIQSIVLQYSFVISFLEAIRNTQPINQLRPDIWVQVLIQTIFYQINQDTISYAEELYPKLNHIRWLICPWDIRYIPNKPI